MTLYKMENGWPTAVLQINFAGQAPPGTMAFANWDAVAAYQAANVDKMPREGAANQVPSEVRAWKVVQVLKTRGHYDTLDAFIRAMTGPNAPTIQARWDFSDAFPRDGQAVEDLLAAALGYTPAQTDDLFREADAILG